MKRDKQLTIAGTLDLTVYTSPEERIVLAASTAFERTKKPKAENTRLAYEQASKVWGAWCARIGARPMPIEAPALIAHLEWLSQEGAAPNTVRLALAALCSLDRRTRVTPIDPSPISLRKSIIVQDWLSNWSRENPEAPRRQASAITARELRRVLELAQEGPGKGQAKHAYLARWARDRCLLLTGVYGALRVSEVVALEVTDSRSTDRGLALTIRKGKTDQTGKTRMVGLMPAGELAVCPVEAWRAWMAVRGSHPGPVFTEIERSGLMGEKSLATRSANRIVQRLAERANLELVTSHSMRASFVTLAVKRKVPLPLIAAHTGHKSLDTLRGYVRQATLFDDDNPSAGLLDGDR